MNVSRSEEEVEEQRVAKTLPQQDDSVSLLGQRCVALLGSLVTDGFTVLQQSCTFSAPVSVPGCCKIVTNMRQTCHRDSHQPRTEYRTRALLWVFGTLLVLLAACTCLLAATVLHMSKLYPGDRGALGLGESSTLALEQQLFTEPLPSSLTPVSFACCPISACSGPLQALLHRTTELLHQ